MRAPALLFVICAAGAAAGQVIPLPDGPDQPAAAGRPALADFLMLAVAACSAALIIRFRWYSLRRPPRRPAILEPPFALATVLLMLLAGALGVTAARMAFAVPLGAAAEGGMPSLATQAKLALGGYAAQAAVAFVLAVRLARAVRPDRDERRGRVRAALVGAAAIALVWPILNALAGLGALVVEWFGGEAPDPIAHETLRLLLESPVDVWFVVMVALVVLAAPVLEELVYRGLLQDALRRLGFGPWPAIAVSSALFALMHWENTAPHGVALLFGLSAAFGWAFERTGRLTASITMHMLFNAANLTAALA